MGHGFPPLPRGSRNSTAIRPYGDMGPYDVCVFCGPRSGDGSKREVTTIQRLHVEKTQKVSPKFDHEDGIFYRREPDCTRVLQPSIPRRRGHPTHASQNVDASNEEDQDLLHNGPCGARPGSSARCAVATPRAAIPTPRRARRRPAAAHHPLPYALARSAGTWRRS
jgi:hypothetical protein